jgi:ribosomal protein S18 acetylase RimI-like enzyme
MTIIRRATKKDIQSLSRKFQDFLNDKYSQVYQDNVAKFGIPDEYVKKAFSAQELVKEYSTGSSSFYVALENDDIVGFAQTVPQEAKKVELDRIIIFPQHTGKGIGTRVLRKIIEDQEQKGASAITVRAGKDEAPARQFYEKNGFKLVKRLVANTPWGKKIDLVLYQLGL